MKTQIKRLLGWSLGAFVVGFCFASGVYVAHDVFRSVDDQSVLWLVNRSAAGYVIAVCVVLGIVTANLVESGIEMWWRRRKERDQSPGED